MKRDIILSVAGVALPLSLPAAVFSRAWLEARLRVLLLSILPLHGDDLFRRLRRAFGGVPALVAGGFAPACKGGYR